MILAFKKLFKNQNFLLFLLLMAVYWRFFTPGPKVANDFPYMSAESLKEGFYAPLTWMSVGGEGMGEYGLLTMWAWPRNVINGALAFVGISFELFTQITGILPVLIVGIFSISIFLRRFALSNWSKFVASFFYLTTTYLILLVDGGQLVIGIAYAFMPLAFVLMEKALTGSLKSKIIAGFTVCLMGLLDIRFVYILFIICFLWSIYFLLITKKKATIFKGYVSTLFFVVLIFLILNLYWIYPMLAVRGSGLSLSFSRLTQTSFESFGNIKHALLLLQPHWYLNVFGRVTPILPQFLLIPTIVLLAMLVRLKNRYVIFWSIIAIIGVFLVKGSNPPLPWVYPWLFDNIPGFSLFRDPTKYFFLVALSYCVLIGFGIDWLINKINWSFVVRHLRFRIIPIFLITYFLLLISPVWLGKMTGTLSTAPFQKEFRDINNILKSDNGFGRVFWIPSRASLGYASPNHPSAEALRMVNRRPFQIGIVGTYEIFNFLREAPFIGELFNISGIKYIGYPFPDTRREILKQDNVDYYHAFLDQLSKLPWIKRKIAGAPVALLEVKNSLDHVFIIPNTHYIVGSDRIYWDLVNLKSFDLGKNALVFVEETPGLVNSADTNSNVILYNRNETDMLMSFVPFEKYYFPSANLNREPDNDQALWTRNANDIIWWRNFLQTKYGIDNLDFDYGGGWAVGEGNVQIQISNDQFQIRDKIFVRAMKSSGGGRVEFWQGETMIGQINTLVEMPEKVEIKLTGYKEIPDKIMEYDKADFIWFKIGEIVDKDQPITIKTFGSINAINALTALSDEEIARINVLINRYNIVKWDELREKEKEDLFSADASAQVSYKKINSAHYKVSINNLTKPATLAFAETYDPLWQANGKNSIPLYSLINGFGVISDGEYDIYFKPQKYVIPGLLMTISGAILFLGGLFALKMHKN